MENQIENIEQLADVTKGFVAEAKADVEAQLETVKSEAQAAVEAIQVPDVSFLAKSDDVASQIDAAKQEILDEVEKSINSIPPHTGAAKEHNTMKNFGEIQVDGQVLKGFDFPVIKSYNDNTDVNGGRVDSTQPYYVIEQSNVLGRQLGTVIPVSGGVVKLPDVSSISWASEATTPINTSVDGAAGSRIPGGTVSSKNVTIETWVSENAYSIASLEDVPAMDGAIAGLMMTQLGRAESTDAVAVVKAATLASGHAVTTGVGSGTDRLPTAANLIGKLSDVREALGSGYGNRGWAVSRELLGRIQESNNTTLNFDPIRGVQTLFGDPVYVVDQLESSATNGNLVGVYGDFSKGLVMATAATASIGRYDQTRPGAMTYFGRARFKHSVWDTSAIVTLKAGA